MDWQTGDLVRHRAGGPKMAVVSGTEDGFYCQFFDFLGRERTAFFLKANLVEA